MPLTESPWLSRTRRHGPGAAVALLLLVLWGLVLWFSVAQQRRLLDESERALALTDRALAGQTDALLSGAQGDLLVIEQWLRQRADRSAMPAVSDDPGLRRLIRTMDEANQGGLLLGLVDTSGRIVLPGSAGEQLRPLAMAPLDASGELPVEGGSRFGLYPALDGAAGMRRVWPLLLHTDAGAAGGVGAIVALINLDRLAGLHESLRQRPAGTVVLIRSDGLVISRVPELPRLVGRNMLAADSAVGRMLGRDEGTTTYSGSATDGVRRLVAFRRVSNFPVSALVTQAVDDALTTYHERRRLVIGLCALLTTLIAALAWVLARARRSDRVRQAQLAAVSDEAPIGMFRAGPDGQLTYVNEAYLRIHQMARADAADGWLQLLPPAARGPARLAWTRTVTGREPTDVKRRLHRPDGSVILVAVNSRPVVVDGQVVGHVGTVADITEQARAQKALRTLTAIFDATTDYVVQTDFSGRLTYMNPAARRRKGIAPDAPIEHLRVDEINPPDMVDKHRREIVPTAIAHGVWIGETIQWDAERREVPVSHIVIAHRGADGRVEYFSGIMRDITAEKAGRQAQQRSDAILRSVAETIPAIVAVLDNEQRYRFTNTAFEQWRGVAREQMVGRTIREVLGEADYARSLPFIERALAGETVVFERGYPGGSSNAERHLKVSYIPLRLVDGRLDGFIGLAQDITEHRIEEARLRSLSRVDALTGALNRAGFEHALEQRSRLAARPLCALLYIDLDRFKQINDQHGHPTGDEVLRIFAQRLRHVVRDGDAIARLGGDEFAVLLDDVRGAGNAEAVAEKVLAAATEPVAIEDLLLHFGASVGIALWPPGDLQWPALIERADRQLYRAKAEGRGRYALDS